MWLLPVLSAAAFAAPVVVVDEAPGSLADPSAAVFDRSYVHQVAITLDPADFDALQAKPYTYVEADVTYDGRAYPGVGVRLKGKIGSYRDLYGKSAFKIDFGEFGATDELRGLPQLELNNNVQDCSSLKTALGYQVFELAGSASPRNGWAWVTVNGSAYGMYSVVEPPNHDFLTRRYADGEGNLYDGKYQYFGPWDYAFVDFQVDMQSGFQLESGVDVGLADIHGVTSAIWDHWGAVDYDTATGAVVDWPADHLYFAAEQYVGHVDGYAMNQNNYRVYFDPADGLADLLPWDLDNAFTEDWMWGMSWTTPRGYLADSCWEARSCYNAQKGAMNDLLAAVEPVDWQDELDTWDVLTRGVLEADPRKECSDYAASRDALRTWMTDRPAAMRSFWGL